MKEKSIRIILITFFILTSFFLFFYESKTNENIKTNKKSNQTSINEDLEYTNYKIAINSAKEQGKNIFLFFTADWCVWCKQMKNNTLNDKEVKNFISKENIICYIDIDKNKDIKYKFNIKSIPVCIIINKEEKILKKSEGAKTKKEFLEWIHPQKVSFTEDSP